MKIRFYTFPFLSMCFVCSFLHISVVRGDTTLDATASVVVDASGTTISTSNENTIVNGYYWFQNGFIVKAGYAVTLKIVPAIHGTINLSGTGTLILDSDITLGGNAAFSGSGTIQGNGKVINLTSDLAYSAASDVLTISENLTIQGHGNMVTIGGGSKIVVNSSKTLTLKNMTLVLISTADVLDVAGTLVLDNVRVLFGSTNYTYDSGSLTIKGKSSFSGLPSTIFTYSSSGSLTIAARSELLLDHDITLKHNFADEDNIDFDDTTSCLCMIGSTLESAARTLVLETGTIKYDHHSYLKGSGASGNITLGSVSNPLTLIALPGAVIDAAGNTVTCAYIA